MQSALDAEECAQFRGTRFRGMPWIQRSVLDAEECTRCRGTRSIWRNEIQRNALDSEEQGGFQWSGWVVSGTGWIVSWLTVAEIFVCLFKIQMRYGSNGLDNLKCDTPCKA